MPDYRKYYLLLLLIALSFQVLANDNRDNENPGECKNYVLIKGSSNINKFEFINYNTKINNQKAENQNHTQNIHIPVYDFSGPNKLMLNDFYQLLNAAKYPFINIRLESYDSAEFDEETGGTLLQTQITIAGKTHNYIIPCEVDHCENEGLIIKGNLEVKLSAFDIDPPRKVLGTVKVDDKVYITFSFNYI
ncbi:YceI family protein [Maribellus sediminis]|uniref:YceI family protein n=1 Tax=Maribellus sediminis TaxID=2696285 RepID=UPI0014322FA1|nr:YceI family protein [Maribellus sediminis]